ncbi:MAG: hypothetical protein IT514_11310 [Burkholderiales bacterium]|nr:hypothetical protein [Burkholderiales bacterium]
MREQLRNAKSRQERTELMRQFHERTAQRAQEQGVTLPQRARNHGGAGATLFTPEERAAWRDRSRNAQTPEDRARIRQEYRAQLEQRAKDKGIALAQRGEERRGQERSGTALSLLTQEERTRIRERMRSAQTPQERAALHSETRALIEQRAREKGIELRQYDRGRHRGHGGPQRTAA